MDDTTRYTANCDHEDIDVEYPSMKAENIEDIMIIRWNRVHRGKRVFDILCSALLIMLILWWLIPIVSILQKIFNPGPIFYRAHRVGYKGEEFSCYKFRSMIPISSLSKGRKDEMIAPDNKNYIPKFGKFLRRTNIDELPQLFNVLNGQMSIVGPRPHDIGEHRELLLQIQSYYLREAVRPGLTGWAQVNGYLGRTSDLNKMRCRTDYDLWYIRNWSFGLDINIIVRTMKMFLKSIFLEA